MHKIIRFCLLAALTLASGVSCTHAETAPETSATPSAPAGATSQPGAAAPLPVRLTVLALVPAGMLTARSSGTVWPQT